MSPLLQLVAARASRAQRIAMSPIPQPSFCPGPRETLAKLRAAELAAWQARGGDFLVDERSE